ncbi:hypothetical protein [Bartonella apis]|uniref:hypothetical protein n=1 Tax=Bartonella apis TaxID=1686310 RepID=UPI003BB5E632
MAPVGVIFTRSDKREAEFVTKRGKEKTPRKKNSAKLATEISRGGRQLFKTAKLPRYWQKSHALAEKFQARYNKNARIKMLAGEGVESRYGGNRSGKGD